MFNFVLSRKLRTVLYEDLWKMLVPMLENNFKALFCTSDAEMPLAVGDAFFHGFVWPYFPWMGSLARGPPYGLAGSRPPPEPMGPRPLSK